LTKGRSLKHPELSSHSNHKNPTKEGSHWFYRKELEVPARE